MSNGVEEEDLRGKVALVTGSTQGVGLRVAELLASRGAKVALNGRNPSRASAAIDRLAGIGADTIFEAGDASCHDEAVRVVSETEKRLGPLDILVCSGGTDTPGPRLFQDIPPELFAEAFRARYLSKIFPVRAVLPGMRERQRGSIVLVGTDGGRYPTPGQVLNGAIGAAIILATKALAQELACWKIRVNCLALTLTSDTPLFDERLGASDLGGKVFGKALSKFPFGAPPSAKEVARVAAFLASDESSQVTGQTISVNGGLSFGGW
jgi:3-oxoacyl-[acyl-carrier protein] reductase